MKKLYIDCKSVSQIVIVKTIIETLGISLSSAHYAFMIAKNGKEPLAVGKKIENYFWKNIK